MGRICNFAEFSSMNEGLSTKDAKQTIKDIFDKFDGIVDDKYLKDMWKAGSTLRNLYGKELFDKAWDELIDAGTIETEDGKEWCWCTSKKKETVNEKLDGEELLSAKQKKLPEGLKKGIIANLKKKKPTKDQDEDEEKEDKKDDKEDKDDDKDDKKKSGSDEEKYLTPKQRKLPDGIKKSIIARAKKNDK
jgi:hypothetical protein